MIVEGTLKLDDFVPVKKVRETGKAGLEALHVIPTSKLNSLGYFAKDFQGLSTGVVKTKETILPDDVNIDDLR